jgi:hypothetical protein
LTAFTTIARPFFVTVHMPLRIPKDIAGQQPKHATHRRRARTPTVSTPTTFSCRSGSRQAPLCTTRGHHMVYNPDIKHKRQANGPYMQALQVSGSVFPAPPCVRPALPDVC